MCVLLERQEVGKSCAVLTFKQVVVCGNSVVYIQLPVYVTHLLSTLVWQKNSGKKKNPSYNLTTFFLYVNTVFPVCSQLNLC